MVYVLDMNGQPLMPTRRYGKVRRLLKSDNAVVKRRCPFTIQLKYDSTTHTQPVEVGDDTGYKHNGLSAVAVYSSKNKKEVYRSELLLRTDIVDLLSTRRQNRRTRRNRKTRYRKARFDNRVRSKHKGWLAPSVQNKIDSQLKELEFISSILPVTKITVETASFDIQKIKKTGIEGTDYQQGEQLGFWNVREYVLWRDGHKCQCCKGRSKDPVLNVHHIESRKTGGDAPNNLITLCETCHKRYHKGMIQLPENIKRGASFKGAAFMGIMRWAFYNKVKETYAPKGVDVKMTYGYITKHTRITNNLEKTHCIDALCISGHPDAEQLDHYFLKKKIRCHNRQIHKNTILKGGYRKLNQSPKYVKGFKLFDVVKAKGSAYYIHGRRIKGSFVLKTLAGDVLEIVPSKLKHIASQNSFITERRAA